jgi:hypothetical protein
MTDISTPQKKAKNHWQVNAMKSFRKPHYAERVMTTKKFKRERFDWRNKVEE